MHRPLQNLLMALGGAAAAFAALGAVMALVWWAGPLVGLQTLSFMLFLLVAWLGAFLVGATGWAGLALPLAVLSFAVAAIVVVLARRRGNPDLAFYRRTGCWTGAAAFALTCAAPVLMESIGAFVLMAAFWTLCGALAGIAAGHAIHAIDRRLDPEAEWRE